MVSTSAMWDRVSTAEVPGPAEEKLGPHIRRTAATLWYLYAGLTTADLR